RRHTRFSRDWSSDVCSSDLGGGISEGDAADLVRHTGVTEIHIRATMTIREAPGWQSWAVVPFRKALPGDEHARLVTDPDRVRARSEERRVGKECRSGWSPAE